MPNHRMNSGTQAIDGMLRSAWKVGSSRRRAQRRIARERAQHRRPPRCPGGSPAGPAAASPRYGPGARPTRQSSAERDAARRERRRQQVRAPARRRGRQRRPQRQQQHRQRPARRRRPQRRRAPSLTAAACGRAITRAMQRGSISAAATLATSASAGIAPLCCSTSPAATMVSRCVLPMQRRWRARCARAAWRRPRRSASRPWRRWL